MAYWVGARGCDWWVPCSVRQHRLELPLLAAFHGGHATKRICTATGYEKDMDEHCLMMVMGLMERMVLMVVRAMAASDDASHGKLPVLVQRPSLPPVRPNPRRCRGPATQAGMFFFDRKNLLRL